MDAITRLHSEIEEQHEAHKARLARMRAVPPRQVVVRPVQRAHPPVRRPPPVQLAVPPAIKEFPSDAGTPTIDRIKRAACKHFDVTECELISARRKKETVFVRHIVYFLCGKLTLKSLPEIGRRLGKRDHTTILSGLRKVERLLPTDMHMRASVEYLTEVLGGKDVSAQRRPKYQLSIEAVRKIRAMKGCDYGKVAAEYGVSRSTVYHIAIGRSWVNV